MNQDLTLYVDVDHTKDVGNTRNWNGKTITCFFNSTRHRDYYSEYTYYDDGTAEKLLERLIKTINLHKPCTVVLDVPSDFRSMFMQFKSELPRSLRLYQLREI